MIAAPSALKKRLTMLLIIGMVLSLGGCYQADFPIGSPQAGTIDKAILGQWRCVQGGKTEKDSLSITAMSFDERQYYMELDTEGEKPIRYRAFSAAVRGATLLNLQELDSKTPVSGRKWIFVRYSLLKPNILNLELVKDEAMKGVEPSRSAVREFIEKNISNPGLYRDFCVCMRETDKKQDN